MSEPASRRKRLPTEGPVPGVTSDELTLAQDLAARVCHDLGGAVGIVAGMLDLVGDADGEALADAREGAAELRRRLLLWRAATGGAGPLALSDLSDLSKGQLAGGRATLSLKSAPPLSAESGQILLLAAMVAAEALPRGGTVEIASESGEVLVLPDGPLVRWPAALLALLSGQAVEAGPRSVLPRLFLLLARAHGWDIDVLTGNGAGAPMVLRPPRG
ncbi:MAG: histidine phosphotransferase family protein [Acetobacteraceae bacterium]